MNRITSLSIVSGSLIIAVLALGLVTAAEAARSDEDLMWEDAQGDVAVRADAEKALRDEVVCIRQGGMRFAFQPPPEGTSWGWMKGVETPEPSNWKYNEKNDCLESKSKKDKDAVIRFTAPAPGPMFLWFRYRDVKRQVNYTGAGALVVTFRQDGKVIGRWRMPRCASPLCDRKGWAKYGVQDLSLGWPVSVWQDAAVKVPKAGEVEAVLSVVDGGSYSLNAWAATPDPLYEPRLEDFFPLWIRFKSLPGETKPFKVRLFKGIYLHAPTICAMTNAVPVGGDTGWFYAARFAGKSRTIECTLSDGTKGTAQQNRFASAELSRTPDEKGVFFREELKGHGNRIAMQLVEAPWTLKPDAPYTVRSNVTESQRSLKAARALAQRGRVPQKFRFELPLGVGKESYEPFINEMNVSLELGCTVQSAFYATDTSSDPTLDALRRRFMPVRSYRSPMPFGYYENGYNKCICSVQHKGIAEWAKRTYEGTTEAGDSGWWDEPGGHPARDCVIPCTKAYREYLKELKLTPKDVGAKIWDKVFPVQTAKWEDQKKSMDLFAEKHRFAGSKAPKASMEDDGLGLDLDEDASKGDYDPEKAQERFYWSMRFHITKLRRFLAFATAEVEKYNRNVRGGACLSPDIVDFYDGIKNYVDWFDFFEHRGFNNATSEDWHNVSGDFAVCGFLVDFLRGCTRRQGQPIRMATVTCNRRTPWQVAAKAFTEIGHGAKDIWFYGYGPSYARMDESSSDVPGMMEAIKSVTFPVGAVEDALIDGKKPEGQVALLYSLSSDLRAHAGDKSVRDGSNRIWTDMLLTHLGRDVDIINEDGLFDLLDGYRFLWCGEAAIRRDCLKPLLRWVKAGGTLFVAKGALASDEFGRPLGFAANGDAGKGHIVQVGRAGDEYRAGRRRSTTVRGFLDYPEDVRTKYAEILDKAGVPVAVRSSVYNVEAHLHKGKDFDVLVVANWSGVPKDVELTVRGGSYSSAEVYNSASAAVKSTKDGSVITLKSLPAGDCIRLSRSRTGSCR